LGGVMAIFSVALTSVFTLSVRVASSFSDSPGAADRGEEVCLERDPRLGVDEEAAPNGLRGAQVAELQAALGGDIGPLPG